MENTTLIGIILGLLGIIIFAVVVYFSSKFRKYMGISEYKNLRAKYEPKEEEEEDLEEIDPDTKPGIVQDLLGIGMTLVTLSIGVCYGFEFLEDFKGEMGIGSAQYNVTTQATSSLVLVSSFFPIIGGVVIVGLVLGIIIRCFARGDGR